MPSSVLINGKRIYKPGIYGVVDASALGGKGTSTGNLAVVGVMPGLESGEVHVYTAPADVRNIDTTDLSLARLAKLAFSPSTDARVPGGADNLYLVNVQPNTQAAHTFKDKDGTNSLTLASKLWGSKGNQTYLKMVQNATDTKLADLTIARGGVTETYSGLGSGPVFEAYYDGADLTATTLAVSPTAWSWLWTTASTALPGGGLPNKVTEAVTQIHPGSAQISATLAPVVAGGKTATVKITGTDHLGVDTTETLSFVAGEGAVAKTTVKKWSAISEYEVETTDDGTAVHVATLTGTSFDLDPADFNDVGEMASYVNQFSAKGYHVTAKTPTISAIPADEVDTQTATNVLSPAKLTARADLWATVQTLAVSALVEASRHASAVKAPKHFGTAPIPAAEEVMMAGGGETTPITSSHWETALALLDSENVQIVSLLSEDATIHQLGIAHVVNATLAGYERNVWAGATKQTSLADLFTTYTSVLNTRHVAITPWEVKIATATGGSEWVTPMWFALQLAAMQAGTPAATPLTDKRPAILDARAAWKPSVANDNAAIAKGLVSLTKDQLGWKVLRSVTTYLTDDNPIYSEVSANESINTSIRRVRNVLQVKVGNPATASAEQMRAVVADELDAQVADEVIKAWQNIVISDLGDRYRVSYEPAAIEPTNFFEIYAYVQRIAA